MNKTIKVKTTAILLCPKCGKQQEAETPTNTCQYLYKCINCHEIIKPREGDCCVFCSYADIKYPPKQMKNKNFSTDNI